MCGYAKQTQPLKPCTRTTSTRPAFELVSKSFQALLPGSCRELCGRRDNLLLGTHEEEESTVEEQRLRAGGTDERVRCGYFPGTSDDVGALVVPLRSW